METLNIRNVHQEKLGDWKMKICFTLDERKYSLNVIKNHRDVFEPDRVYHKSDGVCPLCHESTFVDCRWFRIHLNDLFNQLIEHPNIRLEWLYLDHV